MWLKLLKNDVVDWSGLSRPDLHVVIGLIIFGLAYLALRRAWLAWGLLLAIELANEANDLLNNTNMNARNYATLASPVTRDSLDDIFCTMVVPTMIVLAIAVWKRRSDRVRVDRDDLFSP